MIAAKPGVTARGYVLDVSSNEAVFAHADEVSGISAPRTTLSITPGRLSSARSTTPTIEEFEWQLGVNMWGVLYGTKAFLPMMLEQKEGCIVNISSVFGLLAFPTQSAYNMSKFAVRGLTEALWIELAGSGVRAVCVHPGGIRTNIGRTGRSCAAATEVDVEFARKADDLLRTPPDHCAADIIRGLRKGSNRIITGNKASTMFWMTRLFPNRYPQLLRLLG